MPDADPHVLDYERPDDSYEPEPREAAAIFMIGIFALVLLGMFVVIGVTLSLV